MKRETACRRRTVAQGGRRTQHGYRLNPASLTVDGDTAASKSNRLELLDDLDASSSAIAATMRTHEVDRRVNNSRAADPRDPGLIEPLRF